MLGGFQEVTVDAACELYTSWWMQSATQLAVPLLIQCILYPALHCGDNVRRIVQCDMLNSHAVQSFNDLLLRWTLPAKASIGDRQ